MFDFVIDLSDFFDDEEFSLIKENNIFSIKSKTIESETINIVSDENKDIKVTLFPIIKTTSRFKKIKKLPKIDYFFLFLWELDQNNILIFSNDIAKYFSEYCSKNVKFVEWGKLKGKDEDQFYSILENLTSSFYLFRNENTNNSLYKWKNILSFFDVFIAQALAEKTNKQGAKSSSKENIKNLIYAVKGDSISFFKARYMQEKTIKTLIEGREGEAFLTAMFFGNLIKNLTLKINGNLIDLNGRGLGGFNLKTSKNNYSYFVKINKLLEAFPKGTPELEIPIFFIDKDNNKNVSSFSFDNVIDIFPKAFKEDSNGNIYVLDFKDKNQESSGEIQQILKNSINSTDKINKILKIIKKGYHYVLLDDSGGYGKLETNKKGIKELTKSDLFILFNDETNVFLGKIKGKTKHREEYIEMYKLHQNVGKYAIGKSIEVKKNKNKNKKVSSVTFKVVENETPLTFQIPDKSIDFELGNYDKGLIYFFNGASFNDEDKISIGLIYLLNGGTIYIGDKKAEKGELADIIGYKYDEKQKQSTIQLLHIKTAPFLTDGRDGSYSYYSTAIGQMLQKIEPILNLKEEEIEKFFNKKGKAEVKSFCAKHCKKIKEFNTGDMINNLKKSDSIVLQVGIPILQSQVNSFINNGTFYMIENILIKGFENTIKPFLKKQVTLFFCPIVIKEQGQSNKKSLKNKIKQKNTI